MMISFSSLKLASKLIWLEGIEKLFVSKSTLAGLGLRTNAPNPGTTTVSRTNSRSDMASAMEIILFYQLILSELQGFFKVFLRVNR